MLLLCSASVCYCCSVLLAVTVQVCYCALFTDCYCCPSRSRDRTSSEGTHPHALGTAWLDHILVAAVGMRRSGDESCFFMGCLGEQGAGCGNRGM